MKKLEVYKKVYGNGKSELNITDHNTEAFNTYHEKDINAIRIRIGKIKIDMKVED